MPSRSRRRRSGNLFDTYTKHGYELIPLPARSKKPGEGWTTRVGLTASEADERIRKGGNVGVRLRAVDLVVDVDPRNGGSLEALPMLNREDWPVVETPGGGWHIYTSIVGGQALRHTIRELPGIEFKTLGRQVVGAWSTHPDGGLYVWDPLSASLPCRAAPEELLELIRVSPAVSGGIEAEWSAERLGEALRSLRAEDYAEHDRWFSLMCACHEATGGLGLEEFVEWSTSDPVYHAHADIIRSRWRSLQVGREGGAGVGTLVKELLAAGAEVTGSIGADFEELDTSPEEEIPDTLMQKMSKWYKAVDEDGRLRVFAQRNDEVLGRKYWVKYARRDFFETCQSVMFLPQIEVGQTAKGDPKFMPAGQAWLDLYPKKSTYTGITFAPEHKSDKTPDGKLNLWRGFAVEPRKGKWHLLERMVFEQLCLEDLDHYDYVIKWMARAVQRPWEPGGVALVIKGPKGTGKGTLGRAFVSLFGQHGLHIASPDLLTGRFNAHLRDCCAIFADEAFWAGDKAGESKLKALVTEPRLAFEGKGTNAEMGRNCLHMYMASNMDWVVPAGSHNERRFAVFEAADDRKNKEYWQAIEAQMKNGGLAAMLCDLLAMDLSEYNVFAVPATRALAEQKMRTMDLGEQWLLALIDSGEWHELTPVSADEHTSVILAADLQQSLIDFYRVHARSRTGIESIDRHLGIMLKKLLGTVRRLRVQRPEHRTDLPARPWAYVLPSPVLARKKLEEAIGTSLEDE